MNAKVHDLMTGSVVTVEPHTRVDRVRRILQRNKVGAIPVVDTEGRPVGILSTTDLVPSLKADSPVSKIMTQKVFTVSQYEDVSVAARLMWKRRIHRLVVTHEQKVVGIITTFDLLELVQGRRWVAKNPPSESRRKKRPRRS